MLREFIASQFKKPTGLFGLFTSNLMIKGNQKNCDRVPAVSVSTRKMEQAFHKK